MAYLTHQKVNDSAACHCVCKAQPHGTCVGANFCAELAAVSLIKQVSDQHNVAGIVKMPESADSGLPQRPAYACDTFIWSETIQETR